MKREELDIRTWAHLKIEEIKKMDNEESRQIAYEETIRMMANSIRAFQVYQGGVEKKIKNIKKTINAAIGGRK